MIAEHGGTREKAGIISRQLSLYTAKVLPEHTLDTVLDLGSRGPEGSRAPKGKRVWICIYICILTLAKNFSKLAEKQLKIKLTRLQNMYFV